MRTNKPDKNWYVKNMNKSRSERLVCSECGAFITVKYNHWECWRHGITQPITLAQYRRTKMTGHPHFPTYNVPKKPKELDTEDLDQPQNVFIDCLTKDAALVAFDRGHPLQVYNHYISEWEDFDKEFNKNRFKQITNLYIYIKKK